MARQEHDAVLIRMLESRDRALGPIADLFHGLRLVAQDQWDMNELVQDINIYWTRVLMIQREINDIQRRFWVEIESLPQDTEQVEAGAEADVGFSCDICLFSLAANIKFTLSIQIRPKDILDFPTIDFSTMDLTIHYGALE